MLFTLETLVIFVEAGVREQRGGTGGQMMHVKLKHLVR